MARSVVSISQRFWLKVNKDTKDECWLWTGSRKGIGYGELWDNDKQKNRYAHRISWELHNGPIPKRKCVLHKCDNPLCVNPNHLYLGTHSDNMYDRSIRNREGDIGVAPKLCSEEIQLVKELYKIRELNMSALGRKFGVSHTTIGRIVK